MSATLTQVEQKGISKEVWIGWVSSLVEAYNMAIYIFMAPLLATLLFKNSAEGSAIFFSHFLVFVGSCLFYPAGSIYYGFLGDRWGRQTTCIYSTLGLAIATGLMGLVPFEYFAGNAWILFLILICAQNFFSGGEYYGSIVFSLEHSDKKQGGAVSGLSCLFAVFGLLSANGLAALTGVFESELFMRLSFFIGGIGGFISYCLKNHCQETPAFTALSGQHLKEEMSWKLFIQSQWKKIGTVVMLFAFFVVGYAYVFIFLPLLPFDQTSLQNFDTFKSLMMYGLSLVAAGFLADKLGLAKVMQAGVVLFLSLILPLLFSCDNLLILQIVLTAFISMVIGPIHGWAVEQFEPKNRCRGIFISYAIATSLFGGSTVPICLLIFEKTASVTLCGVYPLMIAIGSFFCLLLNRETKEVTV